METIWKIAAGGIIAAILISVLKNQSRELSPVLSLAACAVFLSAGIPLFKTAADYLKDLWQQVDLQSALVAPVIKICAVGALTQITGVFCRESGEVAVGKVVELCGGAAAVCAMLPLMDAVLELIRDLLGG